MRTTGCLAYVSFGDISFYLQETKLSSEGQVTPVAIFRRGNDILARRFLCPKISAGEVTPQSFLARQLRSAISDEIEACREDPVCRECVRAILEIHDGLSAWLPPERYLELLDIIENCPPEGVCKYPFKVKNGDPRFPFTN